MNKFLCGLIFLSAIIFVGNAYIHDREKTECVEIKVACFETEEAEDTITKEVKICHTSSDTLGVEDYVDLCPKKNYPGDDKKLLCSSVVDTCYSQDDEEVEGLDVCNTEGHLVCKTACDACFDPPQDDDDDDDDNEDDDDSNNLSASEWSPKRVTCTDEDHFEQTSKECYSSASAFTYGMAAAIAFVSMIAF